MTSTFENFSKIGKIFTENIDDLIFIINEKDQVEYTNFQDFFPKKKISEFIHPEDLKRVNGLIKDIFRIGLGTEESQIKYEGKTYRWYQIKGKSFIDIEESKKKALLICREITKFKKFEFDLKRSQARFDNLADYVPEIQFWKLLQTREGKSVVQKTREMLELVLDNIPQLIYWKDRNLVYMGCNKNFAFLNKLKDPTTIIGRTDTDLIWLKNNIKSIQDREFEVMNSNKPVYNAIESLTTLEGKETWFEINRIPLYDSKGIVIGILVTYEDITLRKMAEQKLKESEEKYRGILENMKEGYFEVDLNGNFMFFNDALCELQGSSREELIGVNFKNFVDDINRKKIIDVYKEVYETGKPKTNFQYQFLTKNGEEITCESSVYLIYDSNANRIGFSGLARNITEKFSLEQKIKESEEKYRTIFSSSPDYIFITNTMGEILDMNPALLEKIGMTLEEVRNKNFLEFYAGDKIDDLRAIGELIVAGNEVKGVEVKAKTKTGEIFEYEVNSVPLKEDGKVTKILNLARDISLRKQTERRLKESEKRYRHLFESSPYAIWLMDEEGIILDCNSTMTELLSVIEIKDLIGKKFSEVLSVLKRSDYLINMLKDRFKRFLKGEKLGPLEFQITRVDETKIWLSIQSSLVKIGDKTLTQAIIQDITGKKNAEKKIKDSEIKYRHLFESSPYSIMLIDRKGKIIDCNPATEKLFKRRIVDLINKNFLEVSIKPEKALPLFRERYQSIMKGIVPEPLEIQITRSKDGKLMWISIDDSLVELGGETIFQVIIQDVTEKKQAEQELKKSQEELQNLNRELEQKVLERSKDLIESEHQYRTTIDSLNDPMHVIDEDLRIILSNSGFDQWLAALGIDKKIVGQTVFEAFPFLNDDVRNEYEQVFNNGKTLLTEGSIFVNNMEIFTETRKIPIFREGKVKQIITVIRDISDSKKMENQLKESENNFRNMITNLDEGYYKVEWEGKILYHNPAFSKIAGFVPSENLIGTPPPFSWQKKEDQERYREELLINGVIRNYIVPVTKKNGEEIVVQVNAHLIRDENNKPFAIEGTFSDITEKFRLEQELLESEKKLREQNIELKKLDKVKNDFITMAAHELKTPLISISGYTDYILMRYRNQLNPEITTDLLTVQRNINRLEVLMDQLLEVLKIDENELKLQKELTNVSKIINDCLDELSYLINEKNLEIILNMDLDILLNVDSTRIFTVFVNLISNAIKFTPDYGWIEITAKKEDDKYIFNIKDNGIGLIGNELTRLFKKFERIKPPIMNEHINIKDSGTGLGLYITKGIITAHGGKIWASSEGENKGSTFSFTLPI
ncbi:MAG: PAS domain S-box protein [Promethearchaeota archaeon]|nr:MAG: PAS domain S-box protein [Candidatus Lokiarchaeota archaeon]